MSNKQSESRKNSHRSNVRNTELDFRESALQHLDGLYGYAMTLVRNQSEAEDLVQETYLRAIQSFSRTLQDSNLKSWLFTILRNVRLNQVRDVVTKARVVEVDEPSGRAPVRGQVFERSAVLVLDQSQASRCTESN